MRPGVLAIEVEPSRVNGSIAATVNIEPLIQGEAVASAAGQRQHVTEGSAAALAADIRLLGHIAGIGDVYANANEWLAGPVAPSRIEGISLEWPTKPDGVDIRYSVKTAQPLNISGRIVDLGAFVGTRGRAMALTGLMLELSGPDASLYQFSAECLSRIARNAGKRRARRCLGADRARAFGWAAGGASKSKYAEQSGCSAAKLRKANRKISCSDGRARLLGPLNTGPGEFVRPRSRFPQPA